MKTNYHIRFLRDDLTVKRVTGFPKYEGALALARELVGGRIISAQVHRSSDGKCLARVLTPEFEGIMDDFFAFEAAVR